MTLRARTKNLVDRTFGTLGTGETLKIKVLRGGAWLGAGSLAEQSVRFARNIILARILAPDAFGTMAIVLSAGSIVDTITEIGVREAVIQNPRGTEREYLNASWWLALLRGLPLYAIVFFAAPSIAKFYGNTELGPLLRVTLLSIVFFSLLSPGIYGALKQMKFHKWALINHGGGICGVLITLGLSFYLRNVWALVIGYAAEGFARCVLSYIVCPYSPDFGWDRGAIRELLHFSKGLFGLSFLNLVFARTDIFVLAKLYPAAELGLYAMAIYLAQTPTSFVMNMLGQTLLPTFSNIRSDKVRINRILLHVTSAIALIGMPALVFSFFCSRSLLTLVYGSRYGMASTALFVASCVAIMNLLNGQLTTVFYAGGHPRLHRRSVAIMAVTMLILIFPFAKNFGLVGGQMACMVSIAMGFAFQLVRSKYLTGLNLRKYFGLFAAPFLASVLVGIICISARAFVLFRRPMADVLVGLSGCLVAYVLTCFYVLHRDGKLLTIA
jgi:lipopolysaccharide exporter